MSLSDEFESEVSATESSRHPSRIEAFIDTLSEADRAEFDAWLKDPKDKSAMYRVLKRRGLDVASPTFTSWVNKCR